MSYMESLAIWGNDDMSQSGSLPCLFDVERCTRTHAVKGFRMKQLVCQSRCLVRGVVVCVVLES